MGTTATEFEGPTQFCSQGNGRTDPLGHSGKRRKHAGTRAAGVDKEASEYTHSCGVFGKGRAGPPASHLAGVRRMDTCPGTACTEVFESLRACGLLLTV